MFNLSCLCTYGHFAEPMTAVLTDRLELTCPLSAFAAFQLGHFCPRDVQPFIEKDNIGAGGLILDTDPILIRAVSPHSLYTRKATKVPSSHARLSEGEISHPRALSTF